MGREPIWVRLADDYSSALRRGLPSSHHACPREAREARVRTHNKRAASIPARRLPGLPNGLPSKRTAPRALAGSYVGSRFDDAPAEAREQAEPPGYATRAKPYPALAAHLIFIAEEVQ